MIAIWGATITLSLIGLFTSNLYPLIAGLIMAGIGTIVERQKR